MSVNYNMSTYYIEDGYFYRIDGNNHKSRIPLHRNEYEYLEYCKKVYPEQRYFDYWAAIEWRKCVKHQTPEHFTIRRNKKIERNK